MKIEMRGYLDNPLISVVIITYNHERFIGQTIESILAQQTKFDYEIVVGEDCSTDETRTVIRSYQEKYPGLIRLITSDKNVGLLENYYRTISKAKGRYIACCAGDDFWHHPLKLERQVSFLEGKMNYGMVHSGADLIDENGKFLKRIVRRKEPSKCELNDTLSCLLAAEYPVFACSSVFRKTLFDQYFNLQELKDNNILMEDTPFWIEIAVHSEIHYFEESFIKHRIFEGTISNPKDIEKKVQFINSSHCCLKYFFQKYKHKLYDQKLVKDTMSTNVNKAIALIALDNNNKKMFCSSYETLRKNNLLGKGDELRFFLMKLYGGWSVYIYSRKVHSYLIYHLKKILLAN